MLILLTEENRQGAFSAAVIPPQPLRAIFAARFGEKKTTATELCFESFLNIFVSQHAERSAAAHSHCRRGPPRHT